MERAEIPTTLLPEMKKYASKAGLIKSFLSTCDPQLLEVQIPYCDGLTQEIPTFPIRNTHCKTLFCVYDVETADILAESADTNYFIKCSICDEPIDINNCYLDIDLHNCITEVKALRNQLDPKEASLIELYYNRKLSKFFIKDSQGTKMSLHKKSSILIKSEANNLAETKEINFTFVCVNQSSFTQLIAFFPSKNLWSKPITLLDEKINEPAKLPNYMHFCASTRGEAVFTGGLEAGQISNQTFSLELDYFTEKTVIRRKKGTKHPRIFHCGVYVERRYYVAGGVDNKQVGGRKQDVYLSSVEVLDLDTFEWETLSSLNKERGFASMCASIDSKYLYVFGGVVQAMGNGGSQYQNVSEIERFSLSSKSWEIVNVMKLPSYMSLEGSLNQRFCVLAAKNDNFIIFGGSPVQFKTEGYNKILSYDLSTNELKEGPELGLDIRKFESGNMSHSTQVYFNDCYYVAMMANQATKLCVCIKYDVTTEAMTVFK